MNSLKFTRKLNIFIGTISIEGLSDILKIVDSNSEFYGLNKVNPFDIILPVITFAISAYSFRYQYSIYFSTTTSSDWICHLSSQLEAGLLRSM
jgi:hypothetical protein